MKVLITGAGGMAGSHMVEYFGNFSGGGYQVTGTYYKPTVNLNEIRAKAKLLECDIRYPRSIGRIIEEFQPEQIYHLAAQSYPQISWERPFETMDININGTISVFEAVKDTRKVKAGYDPVVVVACSSAEYGETLNELKGNEVFVKETAKLKPLHPYGVSKAAQDFLAYQYYKNDNIRCIRARIFNSTGVRKVNDATSDFTYRAVEAERNGSYRIRAGNLETRRAILDQRDLIRALVLLAEKGMPGEAYNISSEHIYQMRDIIAMIETEISHKLEIITDKCLLRPSDEKVIAGNTEKLKRHTGWSQKISMEQTVSDMLQYWRKLL